MTKIKGYIIGIAVLVLSACATGVKRWTADIKDYAQTSDKAITVQAAKLPYEAHDSLALNFKVRILVKDAVMGSQAQNENQLYRMDSCFYMQSGTSKYYPVITQAIATGTGKHYEYLVSFEAYPMVSRKTLNLVYQDKYINKKSYVLLLK
jgi:hypothetical protein